MFVGVGCVLTDVYISSFPLLPLFLRRRRRRRRRHRRRRLLSSPTAVPIRVSLVVELWLVT